VRANPEIFETRLRKAEEILFLCHGNINRSILAERCLNHSGSGPRFLSAGLHPRAGRPADPTMVDVAASQGVSLEDARSRCVAASMVESADIVFVMETQQLLRFRDEYPEASDKVWLLGVVGSSSQPLEVADPYGEDRASYERCFHDIRGLTSALATRLDETREDLSGRDE
jgi:protein-tyrosine-phosphatase